MGFTLGTVFNSGTDWEFTVSQETIAEAVQAVGGITEADIADYCYCALIDTRVVAMIAESTRSSNDGLYPWATEFCAAYNTNNGAHPSKVQMNVAQKDQNPVTCYQRNIITYYGTISGKTGHFLVMDIADIKKWIMDYDVYPAYNAGSVTSTAGFPGYTGACYVYNEANVARVSPYQPVGTPTADLFLMNVFATESTLWIGALNPTAHSKERISNEKLSHQAWEFDYAAADVYNTYYTGYIYQGGSTAMQGWSNFPDAEFPDPPGPTTLFDTYLECDDSVDGIIRVSGQYGNNSNPYITGCEQGHIVKTLHGLHTVESWGGLLFKDNGVVYKPIIEGGLVTGFTSDMDIPSEWDDMTNVTGNNISPTPPIPPSEDDDDYADMGIGTGGNVGGLTSYAIMDINDLADLIADFNSRLEAGQSVVNNFVCCYKLGPLSSFLCTTGAHNIIMSAYSTTGNNFVSTRADYAVISSQKDKVLLGSYTVPRKTNTYYDFAPYTTYELFIPCCGWVPLPDSVAGRTIQVYLVFDLASCVCKGICRIDGTTVAEVSGVIGSSVPFYINDSGLARAALVTGVTQTLGNVAMGAVGAMGGNPGLAVMGLVNAVQSAQQTAIAGNTNYTSVRGGNGDMSAYANGEYCTIKITHPVVDPVVNSSMFGHTVGYLCETVGKLSNFHGFTVCANPHVHINATSAERDEITQLLEQGVILP